MGTLLWLAGSYGFYRYMMGQCERAARQGYEAQRRWLQHNPPRANG